MQRIIELRSDTFTLPTESMRRAMAAAEVGDDVWDEDPTIHRLQERAAEMVGKEASLFVPSGTMGNLCALISHTEPGDEVLVEGESHIFHSEVAGASVVGGLQLRPLDTPDGRGTAAQAALLHLTGLLARRGLVVLVAILSWLAISNHCALALAARRFDPAAAFVLHRDFHPLAHQPQDPPPRTVERLGCYGPRRSTEQQVIDGRS